MSNTCSRSRWSSGDAPSQSTPRAYHQNVLKGRTHLDERAVIKRAFKLIFQSIKPSRVRLTADRGFADEPLFALLQQLRVRFVIRVKGCVKVCFRREWRKPESLRVPRGLPSSDVGAIALLREITAPPVGPSKPCPRQAGAVGDLVFSQQLRQGCAPSYDRIFSALQLRRGLQG